MEQSIDPPQSFSNQTTSSSQHIRPTIRKKNKIRTNPKSKVNCEVENDDEKTEDLDLLLNNIRNRMTQNLTVSKKAYSKTVASTPIVSNVTKTHQPVPLKGILKTSQNKSKSIKAKNDTNNLKNNLKTKANKKLAKRDNTSNDQNDSKSLQKEKAKVPMNYEVIERPVSIPKSPMNTNASTTSSMEMDLKGAQIFAASAIEGYETTLNEWKTQDLNQSQSTKPKDDHFWNRDVFDHDTDTDMDSSFYDEDDYEENDDDVNLSSAPPKAFLFIWQALSDWITPRTVHLVQEWQTNGNADNPERMKEWISQEDRSDVGASRCAGLMSILKMHIPKSLEETSLSKNPKSLSKKEMQHRLSNLCRTFDYTQPMAKFNHTKDSKSYWRTLCCILLTISIGTNNVGENDIILPESAKAIGLTREEYSYFVHKAISSLSASF